MSEQFLTATGLSVTGPNGAIVEAVDVALHAGETLAIVGESGSGKSITARALAGLLPAGLSADGRLTMNGVEVSVDPRDGAWKSLRGGCISLVPQDPFTSLSPRHRCGEQIGLPLRDRSRAQRTEAIDRALADVGLPQRVLRQYPFELSGGMLQRVAIAAALVRAPRILIADESTTALDVTTQKEILDLLSRIQAERNTALILISHDLAVVSSHADSVIVLYSGRIAESGSCDDVLRAPAHPYTGRLLACQPPLDRRLERLPSIPGAVPRLAKVGDACTFAPRCALASDRCREQNPPLALLDPTISDSHQVACFHSAEVRSSNVRVVAEAGAGTAPGGRLTETEPSQSAVLDVERVSRRFGEHLALSEVSLQVGRGETVAVVGESGSGKTTLARIIVGLETADTGTVTFPSAEDGRGAATNAQIVFQDPYSTLNPSRTIEASLKDALRAGGSDQFDVNTLLEMVKLPALYARRRPKALSGGERQRVAIARALAVRPRLLVCDEAVSSLDVSVQAQILNLIGELRDELALSVLFISHDLAVVRQLADQVHVLYHGQVVERGGVDDVMDSPKNEYTRRLIDSVPVVRN